MDIWHAEGAILNMLQNGQVDQQVAGQPAEHSERLHGKGEPQRKIETVANSWGSHEQIRNRLLENLFHATTTVMSTLRAIAVKVCTYLRSKGNLQVFLVIAFSIILLLMQV